MSLDDDVQPKLPHMEIALHRGRGAELIEACKSIATFHGWRRSAKELDAIFLPEGRSVSEGVLNQALNVNERNYARMEWTPFFASLSDEPAQVLAIAAGKALAPHSSKLTAEQKVELYEDKLVREFGAAGARMVASISGRRR